MQKGAILLIKSPRLYGFQAVQAGKLTANQKLEFIASTGFPLSFFIQLAHRGRFMELITGISVVALASMAAILINDRTSLGGSLDDSDDFSIFAKNRAIAPVTMTKENQVELTGRNKQNGSV